MQVLFLYATVVLIWGSTWIAITYQLGVVADEVSIAYRFGIGAIALYLYAAITRRRLLLPAYSYPFVFMQGTFLFCLNYILVYYGTAHISSGLVAVVFSGIVISNALFERLFFKTPIDGRLLLAGGLGLTGIALIFWPEIVSISLADETVLGVSLILAAVVVASLGNMTATVNTRRALPVVVVNAHAMAWSSLLSFVIAALLGREFNFSFEKGYIISLAYLAIFGSAIAFGCYLALIRRIGPARAAYSSVLFPVVALAISTFVEGYRWTMLAAVGVLMTLAGNWLMLRRRTQIRKNP